MEYSFFRIEDIDKIAGSSKYIENLNTLVSVLAKNKASILLSGSKGTGKKLIAKVIHAKSSDDFFSSVFISFDCRIQKSKEFNELLGELENHLRIRYQNITVFLENIDCLDLFSQKKIISYIKNQSYYNCRFIFSSEKQIEDLVENGQFDSELYFLICSVLINTIPLENHKEDILQIADYYFEKYNKLTEKNQNPFSEEIEQNLINHFWKGDVEELRLCIEKAFITTSSPNFTLNDFGFNELSDKTGADFIKNYISGLSNSENDSLKSAILNFKKEYLTKILEENHWNQTKTAKLLGIERTYVIKLIKDLNIRK